MGTFRIPVPATVERTALIISVSLLAALAWLALWLTDASADSLLHLHHRLGVHSGPPTLVPLLFVAGWTVMTVAMMLPTSLPILTSLHALARERADRSLLLVLATIGYLIAWAGFGGLVYLGSLGVQWLAGASPWVRQHLWAGAPTLLLLAGLFQFSSLKYSCLDKCRSPLSFVLSHWQGERHRRQAFCLGLDHGLFCVGCCWALMLLMFAVGVHYLGWMLVLGLVMAIEKNMPWGRRMGRPVGFALLAWGATLLAVNL